MSFLARDTSFGSQTDILSALEKCIKFLMESFDKNNAWGEVNDTSWATLVLYSLGMSPYSPILRSARENLELLQMKNGSWKEEDWDTSMAIWALSLLDRGKTRKSVKKAVKWLLERQNEETGAWTDEPWETFYALRALLAARVDPTSEIIQKGVKFLVNAQLDDGSLIGATHYTAMLVEILRWTNNEGPNLSKAEEWLRNKGSTFKWRMRAQKYAFIDSWMLKSLLEISEDPNSDFSQRIVRSLISQQRKDGSWGSIEDTGIVALTLYEVLKRSFLQKIAGSANLEKAGVSDVNMVAESIVHSMLLPCSTEKPEDFLPKKFYQTIDGGILLSLYLNPNRVKLLKRSGQIALGILGVVATVISLLVAFKIL